MNSSSGGQIISRKRKNRCGTCREFGHTKRNCPISAGNVSTSLSEGNNRGRGSTIFARLDRLPRAPPDSEEEEILSAGTVEELEDNINEGDAVILGQLDWSLCEVEDQVERELFHHVPFDVENVGANAALLVDYNPLSFADQLSIFWTREMMTQMINSTNAYGRTFVRGWKEVDLIEFRCFLGIVLYLGCCLYPARKLVWNTGIKGCPFVRRLMARDRFSDIAKAWHYEDRTRLSAEELQALKESDPFWDVIAI